MTECGGDTTGDVILRWRGTAVANVWVGIEEAHDTDAGLDLSCRYAIVVGTVWSPRSRCNGRSILDPEVRLDQAASEEKCPKKKGGAPSEMATTLPDFMTAHFATVRTHGCSSVGLRGRTVARPASARLRSLRLYLINSIRNRARQVKSCESPARGDLPSPGTRETVSRIDARSDLICGRSIFRARRVDRFLERFE